MSVSNTMEHPELKAMSRPARRMEFPYSWAVIIALFVLQASSRAQGSSGYFQETARFPFLNSQSSGFTSATPADLDGNGIPDLIIDDYGIPQFWVVLNPATGGYANPINYNLLNLGAFAGGVTNRLRLGYVDGDNAIDMIIPLQTVTQDVFVLRGLGNGAFQLPPLSQLPVSGVGHIWADDLNADGQSDVVALRVNTPPPSFPLGHWSWDIVVLINSFPGWTMPWSMNLTRAPAPEVAIGDFDGDGTKDLLWSHWQSSIPTALPLNLRFFVAWGMGNGAFSSPSTFLWGVAPSVVPNGVQARSIVVADLNHDGCADIAPLFSDGASDYVRVHFGSPARTFVHGKLLPITEGGYTGSAGQMLLRDVDGDSQEDILVRRDIPFPFAGGGGFDIELFRGTQGGGFVTPPMAVPVRNLPGQPPMYLPCYLAPADLDADGDEDLFGGPGYVNAFVFTNGAISAPGCVLPGFGEPGIGVGGLRPGGIATIGLSGAPPLLGCGLAIGTNLLNGPLPTCGIAVDPGSPYVLLPATTDSSGFTSFSIQVPSGPSWVGSTWFLQWIVPSLGPVPAVSACRKAVIW